MSNELNLLFVDYIHYIQNFNLFTNSFFSFFCPYLSIKKNPKIPSGKRIDQNGMICVVLVS